MNKINFYISSRYGIDRDKLRSCALEVLKKHNIDGYEVDVSVVGKRKITQLNEEHLKHDGPTDVLSFPQQDFPKKDQPFPQPNDELKSLGDIVMSFPEAVQTAKRYGKMVDDQLCFYLEHGLMHLLGYHHD